MSLGGFGCHWLSLAVIGCHWLSLAVIGCHWLSLAVIGCHWGSFWGRVDFSGRPRTSGNGFGGPAARLPTRPPTSSEDRHPPPACRRPAAGAPPLPGCVRR